LTKGIRGHSAAATFKPVEEDFMLTRIYAGLWIVVAFMAGLIYLSGNVSMLVAVVFGFICFGLVFMGMMSVLPSTVTHSRPVRHSVTQKTKIVSRQNRFPERVRAF
jgi:hypothetical protein